MRKNQKEVYRIIDDNTGLYFADRHAIETERPKSGSDWGHTHTSKEKEIIKKALHTTPYGYNNSYKYYYLFDNIGRFYPTQHGAEKMISEFTSTRKYDRDTPAKRVLYGKGDINLRVVKSIITVKDVKEVDAQLTLGELNEST